MLTDTHAACLQIFIWCEATVEEVEEKPVHKSKRHKDSPPAHAVRIRWPADPDRDEPEKLAWIMLNPEDWSKEVINGWRYAEAELRRT